jgi:Holliday junction resolvase-like predicted endonuclease
MRTSQQRRGDATESLVADHLVGSGWRILGRQVRVGRAELDIVAIDPGPPAGLVVVEVRFRGRRDFGLPEESIDHRKLARLRVAAYTLRDAGRLPDGTALPLLPLRIDIVVVEPGKPLRHYRHVG